jgi:hypothetical protein
VSTPAPVGALLLEAALAVATGAADARARVDRLDSLVLASAAVGDAAAYAHIVVSRLYRALGDPATALAAVRRRPYMSAAWPRYLAAALREEGELAEQVGDVEGALAAYRRYLALRADPEAALAPGVRALRELVEALQARPK